MKKIVFLAAIISIFGLQLSKTQAQTSINAAYIYQQHTFNYQNGTLDSLIGHVDFMSGGMLGLSQNVELFGLVGIAPGVYISFAEAKTMVVDSSLNFSTSNINLKIPFYLNYTFGLSNHVGLTIFGGPVFNIGLSRLSNYKDVADQVDLHSDMGLSVGVGLQLSRFRIYVGYNADMIDRDDFSLANKQSVKKAWEGSTLFAGIGFSFGSK